MNEALPIFLSTVAQTADEPSIAALLLEADIVVQLVLLILVGMSLVCWAIIVNKARVVLKASRQTESFLDLFWKSKRLDQVYEQIGQFPGAPVAQVFKAGYVELSRLTSAGGESAKGAMEMGLTENLARSMRRASSVQITGLERMVTFLATTGATAPFIGLFGTVWGILRAFQRIGAAGQASIAVVGPDIAHALIATAVGLLAAIPAVMAFNYFNSRIRVLASEMENFSSDFLNIVKRHFRGA